MPRGNRQRWEKASLMLNMFNLDQFDISEMMKAINEGYSYFRLSAGLARAALITWELTVKAAMARAASPLARKIQMEREARKANPCSQRFMIQ